MERSVSAQLVLEVFKTTCSPNRRMPTLEDLPESTADEARAVNRMEAFWIRYLHDTFRDRYPPSRDPDVVVLSKAHRDDEWNRSEFLHDITVIERAKVRSAYLEREIPVARRILWQVESELSGNGREVAIDFSKLIAGSAENKLLVVRRPMERQTDGQERVCQFVSDMAVACQGNLFLAFLPTYSSSHAHLEAYWRPDGCLPYDLFEWSDGRFQLIGGHGLSET